jgi:hypothetical protein
LTQFAFNKQTGSRLKKFFMVERLHGSESLQYQLVQEEELLDLIQQGNKLQGAYIYGVSDEHAEVDSELFNIERISKVSDLIVPAI